MPAVVGGSVQFLIDPMLCLNRDIWRQQCVVTEYKFFSDSVNLNMIIQ